MDKFEVKLGLKQQTKYTSILWTYNQYQVKAITDAGNIKYYLALTIGSTPEFDNFENSYESAYWENADKKAYEYRNDTTLFNDILRTIRVSNVTLTF